MIAVKRDVRSEEVRQGAGHILFVEGKNEDAIDYEILKILLEDEIGIKPMGPSYHVKSVAEALYKSHPNYYFLIDRDHHEEKFVSNCWDKFPDPESSNLLVWFCREIENYFLIPEYLLKSPYLAVGESILRKCIIDNFRRRLYLDATNQVIVTIREEFKQSWIHLFKKPDEFKTKKEAITRLIKMPEFIRHKEQVSNMTAEKTISSLFDNILEELTGGNEKLEYGRGRWLELQKGSEVLPTIINKCFKVKDSQGKPLSGNTRLIEVCKDLVRKPINDQPADFKRLKETIFQRIGKA